MHAARLTLATLAALVLAATAAGSVLADAPTVEHQTFGRDLYNTCPDFAIHSHFFVDRRVTTYYDNDGTPIRQTIVGVFPGYVENLSTGYTLPAENVRIISIDLLTGETRSTGTNVRVFLPGGGTLQLTAGLQIRDASGAILLDGGRLDQPPTEALCEALGAG